MNDPIFFNGVWRMDWAFGNPNKTAALIAILMVAIWAIAYIRRGGFWAALVGFVGLGICLVHTMSRGGLIAAICGIFPVIAFAPRPWSKSRLIATAVGVSIIFGAALYLNTSARYLQGFAEEDRSISNRILVWKSAPAMMIDAPSGWGVGKSGDAYMQWYQPSSRQEGYRSLVNSHLTWLVEIGWPLRIVYIFGWLTALLLCWPPPGAPWFSVFFGTWIAFFVAASFSSVAESPLLWIVPTVSVLTIVIYRFCRRLWIKPALWFVPIGGTLCITLVLLTACHGDRAVRRTDNAVVLGSAEPSVYVIVDKQVLGKTYGKTLRKYLSESDRFIGGIALVESILSIKDSSDATWIVCGSLDPEEKAALRRLVRSPSKVILVNPTIYPEELEIPTGIPANVQAVFGEFTNPGIVYAWEGVCSVEKIKGDGNFLPNWPKNLDAALLPIASRR